MIKDNNLFSNYFGYFFTDKQAELPTQSERNDCETKFQEASTQINHRYLQIS